MEKVNKVQVTVLGDKHDQAMLITTIKAGRTISITADELSNFNPAEVTSTELDNVFIAVVRRNEKYVPLNGKKFLRKLLDQGVGTKDKPLHVKLLSSVQYKKSRLNAAAHESDVKRLADHFNTKPVNQKNRGNQKPYSGNQQAAQRSTV